MVWQLRCENQHQWTLPSAPTSSDTLPSCPTCGKPGFAAPSPDAPGVRAGQSVGESQASLDDTLTGLSVSAPAPVAASARIDQTLHQSYVPPPPSIADPPAPSDQTLPPPPS